MLRATGQYDAVGVHRKAVPPQPGGHRLPMPDVAAGGDVPQDLVPWEYPTLEQTALQPGDLLIGHQDVDAQVQHPGVVTQIFWLAAADECAASDMARGQSPARRLGVSARNRGHGDAEVVGQVAVRRQLRTGSERPILHTLVDGVSNGA